MAGIYNFKIDQGATFRKALVWRDSAGALVDLSDYSAKLQIREVAGVPTSEVIF